MDSGNFGSEGEGWKDTLVTARGTGNGLILRIDGRAPLEELTDAVRDFLISRRKFLSGNEVSLEWIGSIPLEHAPGDAFGSLFQDFDIKVRSSRLREGTFDRGASEEAPDDWEAVTSSSSLEKPAGPPYGMSSRGESPAFPEARTVREGKALSLFDGIDSLGIERTTGGSHRSDTLSSPTPTFAAKRIGSDRGNTGRTSGGENFNWEAAEQEAASARGARSSSGLSSRVSKEPLSHPLNSLGSLGTNFVNTGSGNVAADSALWDDADCRTLFVTLRSGQRIESEHSVLIFGDVNSGAEIVAGGDIIVLGNMRGVAHAGAYDETGGGRVIVALNLQPTQLRIGAVITRGYSDATRTESGRREIARGEQGVREAISQPEIAYVDGNNIVVEQYQSKFIAQRAQFHRNSFSSRSVDE